MSTSDASTNMNVQPSEDEILSPTTETSKAATEQLAPVLGLVVAAQQRFKSELEKLLDDGGLTRDRYIRYLSMQHHLTKGMQRQFLTIAAHADLGRRRELRKFLVSFVNEEELHFEVAARDLENLGTEPLPIPFDVELWWAYFTRIVVERPFVRLGATCILENISGTSKEVVSTLFSRTGFMTPKNSVFFRIHQQDDHGNEVVNALSAARLEQRHYDDLREGAQKGAILYLRMVAWAFYGDSVYAI